MIKLLRLALCFIFSLGITNAFAQFPYTESFKNATAPGINFGGAPSAFLTAAGSSYDLETLSHTGTPIDVPDNGYLRLTNRSLNQKGYIYSNSIFPSTQGLTVQFEYYVYGGSGADGISFFLYDATASPFNIGGFGGSLGYAQITTTTPTSPGVSKGYLAIGLDEFGNFSNTNEGRQGGITGLSPGSVTLRGKGDGAALTAGNYAYLTSIKTSSLGFSLVGDITSRQPETASPGFRRVLMDLVPNPKGGYNITVRISRGGPTLVTSTVINNYYYPGAAPANLKYGFASSTGASTNFHEIRNVYIDVLDENSLVFPKAANDELTLCQGNLARIDISTNDKTDNAGGSINKASIDLDPTTTGLQDTFTVPDKGVFSINPGGDIIFTPVPSFSGSVIGSYNIKDTYGKTSNNATITLTYTAGPVTPNAGTDQLLNISTPTTTFTFQGNNPGASTGLWTQISGPSTATFVNPAQFNTAINNLSSGVYIFRWTLRSAGGCELFDDVQIVVNHPPVANNDALSTDINTSAAVLILNNDTDADGNNTLNRGSVVIVRQPQNGTLVVDPQTGIVTYTPNNGFYGNDFFVYTVKDILGAISNQATVNIIVNPPPMPSRIGLAKALTSNIKNMDGSYDLSYTFNIINYGAKASIDNVSLTDDLKSTFKNNTVIVKRLIATGNLIVNPAYDGVTVKNMLLPNSNISAQNKEQVILDINVNLKETEGTFNNIAFALGYSSNDGSPTNDQSTNGLFPDPEVANDVSPAIPTPVTLNQVELFIPGGFSPNNDGINDYFFIENAANVQIHLEIFNRWGNRIYRSTNYKNEWNGKTTEGIHIGEDVPVGTYYYIIKIDGKNKKAGPLNIRR
ncbi:gliding motility-associated-like protein [Pedobacter sp. CG_S7]|uniref:T9SS type B sorting domain-containing protein n=1 Tax=Pedobacter sp. CG_S7 TaxID=3143930 RepID=UPI003393534B